MAPKHNASLCLQFLDENKKPYFGLGLTPIQQGGYQMAAQVLTLVMAVAGGVMTGFILRLSIWDNPTDDQLYDDSDFWDLGNMGKRHKRRLVVGQENKQFSSH
jgi:hypothetical protein